MAISQNPPALPPRPNVGTSEHMEFSRLGKTPPAWLYSLVHYSPEDDKHQHEFHLSEVFDNFETVFLCQKCHNWFHLTTTSSNTTGNYDHMNSEQETCVFNSENNLHHLHTTTISRTSISAHCCLCNFTVNIEISEPFIDMRLFNGLSKLRRRSNTYANVVKHTEFGFKMSLDDVINNMIQIVDNVLDDDQYNLKYNCEDFEMDEVSQAFFEKLGFQFVGECLIPPDYLSGNEKRNFKLTKEELKMISFELSESSSYKFGSRKLYEKLSMVLGTTCK